MNKKPKPIDISNQALREILNHTFYSLLGEKQCPKCGKQAFYYKTEGKPYEASTCTGGIGYEYENKWRRDCTDWFECECSWKSEITFDKHRLIKK